MVMMMVMMMMMMMMMMMAMVILTMTMMMMMMVIFMMLIVLSYVIRRRYARELADKAQAAAAVALSKLQLAERTFAVENQKDEDAKSRVRMCS